MRRNKIAVFSGAAIAILLVCLAGLAVWSARVSARQARENLRQAYSSDMNLAMQSFESANLVRLRQILDKYKDVDFRGWEYDFLENPANPAGKIQTIEHPSEVWNVAFSPDGKTLASASSDRTIRFFETGKGTQIQILRVHLADAWSVAFSADNKYLASCGTNFNAFVFDIKTIFESSSLGHAQGFGGG